MTLAELLKSKGITDEVINGLPKDVLGHMDAFATDAGSKLTAAQTEAAKAAETLRLSEMTKAEVNEYVERHADTLTRLSSTEAKNKAYVAYLSELKEKGFDIPVELISKEPGSGAQPIVPGSPAMGGNAFDPDKFRKEFRGEVGVVMSNFLDANNEHLRLFGAPIPESSAAIAEQAARARKPIADFVAEKYKFADKRQENERNAAKAHEDQIRKDERAKVQQENAEKFGSNPNLVAGENSRNSFVPRMKREDFHKADGNQNSRERRERMLDRIHADVTAARQTA